jgi:hypothetical protein
VIRENLLRYFSTILTVQSVFRDFSMAEARAYFGKPEKGERLPLETVTRRLLKTVTEDTSELICSPVLVK